MFSLKKSIFSRLVGSRLARLLSAIRLAILNKRSTSVEVGGGVKNWRASWHMAWMVLFLFWLSCLSQYLRQDTVSSSNTAGLAPQHPPGLGLAVTCPWGAGMLQQGLLQASFEPLDQNLSLTRDLQQPEMWYMLKKHQINRNKVIPCLSQVPTT